MVNRKPVTIDQGVTSPDVVRHLTDPGSVDLSLFREDPEAIRQRIEAQVLGAESPDDLFGDRTLIASRDVIDRSFQLVGVEWRPSETEGEGLAVYAILRGVTAEGEYLAVSCGARDVVLKAAVADAKGWLPLWVKITQAEATAAGFRPLRLLRGVEPFPEG